MIDVHKYYPKKRKKAAKPSAKPLTDKELEEPLSEEEIGKIRSDVMKHPALSLFADEKTRKRIIFDDIKRPTEYDKDIVQESDSTEVVEKSQFAYLAREIAYIGRHLERLWDEKIEGDIAEWYKRVELAFTSRLIPIQSIYKDVEDALTGRLPNLRGDFKAGFEKLLADAKQCDIDRAKCFGFLPVKPIADFKLSLKEFHKIIYAIHREACIALGKLTRHENIVELKPNFYGVGLNLNALIRNLWIKIKNPLKAFIHRILQPK